ncbi:helix-turn-helix domain-containing protein [Lacisediminihabitans sp.]|jgi:transcriptional regulator with XRE-family HTH domain|uniref:helix-turn-helix domain-containing protein n=1 Tax=Lacisediminihabitans sp. TaxID=2787631 RepID=UPI002F9497D7
MDDDEPRTDSIPNTALRYRMAALGFSKAKLAAVTKFDERTIQRWMDGQATPQADNARQVADALECTTADLWPDRFPALPAPGGGTITATVYASRSHIPVAVWRDLFTAATSYIDICVYGGTFLFDTIPGFNRLMTNAAERGVAVRFLAGDPAAANVYKRGEEEAIGNSLPGRCTMTIDRLAPIAHTDGIQIRVHGTPLYASIFRIDDTLVANHHIYGSPASDNPALILTRPTDPDLWDTYTESFDRIWAAAHPAHSRQGT